MRLREYQAAAKSTDQFPKTKAIKGANSSLQKAELVPLLGLTGEIGALLSEYKKLLRDGPIHLRFSDRLKEELGDILWYVATVATKFDLPLEEIARLNLKKVADRWSKPRRREPLDTSYPPNERLPRRFTYRFTYEHRKDLTRGVAVVDHDGTRIGDLLTDNAHENDGYRFHDVMHFAFVALLGWSPVVRKLLQRKRKSIRSSDEVEDGGRAGVVDEAIVAMVFDYIQHDLASTTGMTRIDSDTLRSIRALTRGFEVNVRTEAEWEEAILKGIEVWRQIEAHDGGTVVGDFTRRSFTFSPKGGRSRRRSAHVANPVPRRRRAKEPRSTSTSVGRTGVADRDSARSSV